jgi:hypothetical protein
VAGKMAELVDGDDEFFGNDDDGDCFGGLSEAEIRANEERMYTIGFEAGIEIGESRSAQKGFDAGFATGMVAIICDHV